MSDHERSERWTDAEVVQALHDLRERVARLEQEPVQRPATRRRLADLGLVEELSERAGDPADADVPSGAVAYAGVGRHGDDALAWQMFHTLPDLLALDETVLARRLAAVASPVRLTILRALIEGPLQTHELQERLDEPSAGQLYHHLRELIATGLVSQPRRSVYELSPHAVVPLLTIIACAHDLRAGGPDEATAR